MPTISIPEVYVHRLDRIREELQKTTQREVSLPGLVEEIISNWLYVAESELALSPRMLPVEEIHGKRYFRDNRLREYQNVTNPHDRIPFSAEMQ